MNIPGIGSNRGCNCDPCRSVRLPKGRDDRLPRAWASLLGCRVKRSHNPRAIYNLAWKIVVTIVAKYL